jgi:hypothetical protein
MSNDPAVRAEKIIRPRGALAAAILAAAEAFWKAAGLDVSAEALQILDFVRPWALAMLPSNEPGEPSKTRQVLYIPLRSKSDDLVKRFGLGSMKLIANSNGYAALSADEGELSFPASDIGALARSAGARFKRPPSGVGI